MLNRQYFGGVLRNILAVTLPNGHEADHFRVTFYTSLVLSLSPIKLTLQSSKNATESERFINSQLTQIEINTTTDFGTCMPLHKNVMFPKTLCKLAPT